MATKEEIIHQQQLVEAAKRKPRQFKKLYELFHRPIYLFIINRCNDEFLAADLTSQTFMKAMISLPKYQFKGLPFSAWLYRIAMNEINLHFRKLKKERTIAIEENVFPEVIEEIGDVDPDRSVENLVHCINHLKEDEVELLELRYFEKRSVKEVAAILEIGESNLKTKMHRLIKKMRKVMKEIK